MPRITIPRLLLTLGILAIIAYNFYDLAPSDAQYATQLKEERRQKNEQFRRSPDSPLPEAQRATFDSLHYYAPDPSWRLTAQLERLPGTDTISLPLTDGAADTYVRFARAAFQWQGQPQQLTLLRRVSKTDSTLFVPFTDQTNGFATYGGGRYLDVATPDADASEVVLDFNRTYNPYCAYGDEYACPMPPAENRLNIAVAAGEKSFHD